MKPKPMIIALTGAESTGKSTLTEALANYYGVPFIPEFARGYIQNLHHKYTFEDVEYIARKQVEQYNELVKAEHPLVFLDTWLVITKVWFEVVYGRIPDWLDSNIKKLEIDLFLICDTDLPWEPDDVRENGGKNREQLQQRYIDEIRRYQFRSRTISGSGRQRIQNAIQIVDQELGQNQQI